ncbi:hypothetical protein BDR07DRAFT_1441996 [Suillus spraguei]|nr:hypothetical protein BDR07DRAFT_1441996 [Suillus spraguei]
MQSLWDQVASDVVIPVHDIAIHVHDMEEIGPRRYDIADGAGLDTRKEKECLEGTRTEILSQITDWVSSTGDNVPGVLRISGPAGKDKSAIALWSVLSLLVLSLIGVQVPVRGRQCQENTSPTLD